MKLSTALALLGAASAFPGASAHNVVSCVLCPFMSYFGLGMCSLESSRWWWSSSSMLTLLIMVMMHVAIFVFGTDGCVAFAPPSSTHDCHRSHHTISLLLLLSLAHHLYVNSLSLWLHLCYFRCPLLTCHRPPSEDSFPMTWSSWVIRLIVIALPPRDVETMAHRHATICKTVAVVVIGTLTAVVTASVSTTAAALSPTPMLPPRFANPVRRIALGITIQTNARATAAAIGAATLLTSRVVAIQTDVPSSSPRTQTLIVSVLLMLVTIVIHPRGTKTKTNVRKEAVSGTSLTETTVFVTSRALMWNLRTPKMNARTVAALSTRTPTSVITPTMSSTLKLPLKAATRKRSCGLLPKLTLTWCDFISYSTLFVIWIKSKITKISEVCCYLSSSRKAVLFCFVF